MKLRPEDKIKIFEETGDVDFGYEIPGLARYRANFFMQKNGVGAVFREIPSKIMTCEQLGLPPVIAKLATLPRGLVLVTGPTGSGKSTTLAAIIDEANRKRKDHIITIEDPIEFVHESQGCIVNHREVGHPHQNLYARPCGGPCAKIPILFWSAKCGIWKPSPWPSRPPPPAIWSFPPCTRTSAAKTVDRIIEVFPADEQAQIRSTLADGLRAVIAQVLFKRIDIKGRCAALEILIATPAVRNLIREAKTHQIPSMIQTGKKYGMQLWTTPSWSF